MLSTNKIVILTVLLIAIVILIVFVHTKKELFSTFNTENIPYSVLKKTFFTSENGEFLLNG